MALAQYIYSSSCTDEMTPEKAVLISVKSFDVCRELGLTGRVFSNQRKALAITEGPEAIVKEYFNAVRDNPLVKTMLLHVDRPIETREFDDYSVWLNVGLAFEPTPQVRLLTPDSVDQALPENPSARLRVMADAFLADMMVVA